MVGVRIGEIVHNLRSSLDHVVYHLVVQNTRRAPTTRKNQFPIFQYGAGFNDRGVRNMLHDVAGQAIELVKSEQPFAKQSPLWHLKESSDIDKHRN